MKIREMHASVNGSCEQFNMESGGLEIIAEDGRTLFCISFRAGEPGQIEISTGSFCKHEGAMLDTGILVKPIASNVVAVRRNIYS